MPTRKILHSIIPQIQTMTKAARDAVIIPRMVTAMIVLIVSVFILVYFILRDFKPWQIFLLIVPAIAIAVLSTYINKKPGKQNFIGTGQK